MQHTGTLFLSRTPPQVICHGNEFTLTLLAYDAVSQRRREPWRICWRGEQAQAWWAENKHHITPGRPLHVVCERAQILTTQSRPQKTEIQAEVVNLEITSTGEQS